jgi:hypothetical protein
VVPTSAAHFGKVRLDHRVGKGGVDLLVEMSLING